MNTLLRRSTQRLGVAAAASAMVLGFAATASAASWEGEATAYNSAAFGSAHWDWDGKYRLSNGKGAIRDTGCDGDGVYLRITVTHTGGRFVGPKHWHDGTCRDKDTEFPVSYSGGYRITSVIVTVCVNRDKTGDEGDVCNSASDTPDSGEQ